MKVKFNKYNVRSENGKTSKVYYSKSMEGAITVESRGYDSIVGIFENVIDNSNAQADYFERDHIIIDPGSEYYDAALNAYNRYYKIA